MVSATTKSTLARRRYGAYVRYSFLAALVIHFLLFYFFPDFEIKPYVLPETVEFELVAPDLIEIPPPPAEVAQPSPAITTGDDGSPVEDIDIPPNVFATPAEMPLIQDRPSGHSDDFHVFDMEPELIAYVHPVYPELARSAGIEGTVMLLVLVGDDGKVLSVDVLDSDVTPAMEDAAMAAALQFKFKPAMQGTVPVSARVAVPVYFKLH